MRFRNKTPIQKVIELAGTAAVPGPYFKKDGTGCKACLLGELARVSGLKDNVITRDMVNAGLNISDVVEQGISQTVGLDRAKWRYLLQQSRQSIDVEGMSHFLRTAFPTLGDFRAVLRERFPEDALKSYRSMGT